MKFRRITIEDIRSIAEDLKFSADEQYLERMTDYARMFSDDLSALEPGAFATAGQGSDRRAWSLPVTDHNALGAWAATIDLQENSTGPLSGKTIALKDNIFVAGVPMTNGTDFLSDFVPEFDATVVSRVLKAGGRIVGKATCEYLCVSGGSVTSATGFVRNPHDPAYSAGGSSSGCGALVANGDVDMAIGCDQAGSIRIPASLNGIVGLKPTFGLVPYTGILGMESSIDHAGPMTRTVEDNARLLGVVAGYDEFDGRQKAVEVGDYTSGLESSIRGLRIGVLKEGMDHPDADPRILERVRDALRRLEGAGAVVRDVSVPEHRLAVAVWAGLYFDGIRLSLEWGGINANNRGLSSGKYNEMFQHWGARVADFPENAKMVVILAEYMKRFGGYFYGRAQNLAHSIRRAYDDALSGIDVLALPTTTTPSVKLPGSGAPMDLDTTMQQIGGYMWNTAQFNVSGHPALSVPCKATSNMPTGLMLVGRYFDESTLYRVASKHEELCAAVE